MDHAYSWYKKQKSDYKYFVLLIKYGNYYYSFDNDAKIIMYIFNKYSSKPVIKIKKVFIKEIISILKKLNLNVVSASKKKSTEYYALMENKYEKICSQAKRKYKGVLNERNEF